MNRRIQGLKVLPLFCLALVACRPLPAPAPPPLGATITSFTADKSEVFPGATVTLKFTTERATEVVLTDQAGTVITNLGTAAAGEATVTPAKSTIYVLRAKGEGGSDAAFVQVAVGETMKEVLFVAVPTEVDPGQEAQLIFSAFRSTKVTITASTGTPLTVTGQSGVVTVKPTATTRYALKAQAEAVVPVFLDAEVKVRPVIKSFTADPPAAKSGDKMTFSWTTAAADGISLEEASFGSLFVSSDLADVAEGRFEWTVPGDMPGTDAGVTDAGTSTLPAGFPLRFTLKAQSSDPAMTVSRALASYASDGPRIDTFTVPAAVTQAKTFDVAWTTTNAVRVQLFADGLLVYEPLPTNPAAVAAGSVTFPAPARETTFELVATSFQGASTRASKKISPVLPPEVLTFTAPGSVATGGELATLAWTTKNAMKVSLQVKAGPLLYVTYDLAKVAAGSTDLHPCVTGTYAVIAENAAGDSARLERLIEVTTPSTVSATPNLTVAGTPVKVSWDLTAASSSEVLGAPYATPIPSSASTNFFDLATEPAAVTVSFANSNDSVTKVTPVEGFTFPFIGATYRSFWISTNGFVAFKPTSPLPTNLDLSLTTTTAAGAMVAPFWDDLELGTGQVSYLVDGADFPRRLTVQWTDVSIAGDLTSKLTFQVQLNETGDFKFIYKTLQDTANRSKGESATVGVRQAADNFTAKFSFDPGAAASLSEGQELDWFSGLPAIGEYTVKADESRVYSFFYRTGTGTLVNVALPVRAFGLNSIQVNEAMPVPSSATTDGAWIELKSRFDTEQDLSGLALTTTTSTAPFVLPDGTVIPAKGYLVLGQSTDPLANGDANVTLAWGATDLPMTAADTLSLVIPGTTPTTLSTLVYTAAVGGTSVMAKEKAIDTAGVAIACVPTKVFGTTGSIGTPGAANEQCFKYLLEPRPLSYFDISATGTPLFVSGSMDETIKPLTLGAAPFPHFGVNKSDVQVSSNGFVAFKSTLTSAAMTNKALPTATEPFGIAAIFWDDLNGTATPGSNAYWKRMAAGDDPANASPHWIIQWHHFTHYTAGDDLNFQVKLFDSGVIEYHYATMTSGSTLNYANGNSATVWLDTPTGTTALALSRNTASVVPNSAFIFTPQ